MGEIHGQAGVAAPPQYQGRAATRPCHAGYAVGLTCRGRLKNDCERKSMQKVNTNKMEEESWSSPKGKFAGAGKEVSEALGRKPQSTDLMERHPFDVEICRIAPGQTPYPYHSHSAQWEFYHVMSGKGIVRHKEGTTAIEAGDAFLFKPGEPHQLTNNGTEDLILHVVADNPMGESCHYPDSRKWVVRSPERRLIRSEPLDYYDGEE
jgi:uncharacterized cupin superfamily protein